MQNRLLIVSKELKFNDIYYEYLINEYKNSVLEIHSIKFLDKKDKELFLILQEEINKSDNLLIATTNQSYKIVSKILTTITRSNLIYENSVLIPSNTDIYAKNSYLIEYNNKNINVIKYKTTTELPKILIENKKTKKYLQVLEDNEESLNLLLKPIARSFDITIATTKIIDELILIEAISSSYGNMQEFIKSLKRLYKTKVFEDRDLVNFVIEKLKEKELSISVAESCTGGLISSLITKISGASEVFDASFITYSNEMKNYLLGVDEEIFENYGAVSKECVEAMLKGVQSVVKPTFAMAISGVAGPNGGSREKPVGTVYVGVKDNQNNQIIKRLNLSGSREYIQKQGALWCFKLLLELRSDIFLEE